MAFRRDYSLTKDIDFSENQDIVYSLYDKYRIGYIQGQYHKDMLKEYLTVYKGICGKGGGINTVFDLLDAYASRQIDGPEFSFADEADDIRDAYLACKEYDRTLDVINEELGRKIDGWLSEVNPKAITPEQRLKEIRYIGQVEQILNRRSCVYEALELFDVMIKGVLSEDFPKEDEVPDSLYGYINLPMTTHIPQVGDFDEEELEYSPLMQVLYNIVALNSYIPLSMLHDYNNGNACVRLWRKDQSGYVPFYASITKSEVYITKIGCGNQKALWPGLIEAAFEEYGMPVSKEEMVEAILGPAVSGYDVEYICGDTICPENNYAKEFTETIRSYIKCLYDTYAAFLLTNSLISEDERSYVKLLYGIKECIDAVSCCIGQTLDPAKGIMGGLSELISEYRESVDSRKSAPIVQQRLSVCDTLKELIDLFNGDSECHDCPHQYFEKSIARSVARVLLTQGNKELTDDAVNEKAKLISKDTVFKQETAKMNIHILNHPTVKMAEAILAKMERR